MDDSDNRDAPADAPSQLGRRDLLGGVVAGGLLGSLFAACQQKKPEGGAGAAGGAGNAFGRPIKAAFVNTGLSNTWPAQGKATTERWAKWLGIDLTWYDGGLSIEKQRKAVDDMATKQWDFVAIQAFGIDTLTDPVKQMLDKGIKVMQMDTVIAKDDPGVTTFLEPDHAKMAEIVGTKLCESIGGKGNIIMTQGALGHSGARLRAKGFKRALERFPDVKLLAEDTADWDPNKAVKLWEDYLVKWKQIDAGFFHNDDMALAAGKAIKNADRKIVLGSIDAMPEAIQAVKDGRLLITVRNSSARIHWGALVVGAIATTGVQIPKYIHVDGPTVTKEIADGIAFMEDQFLV